MKDELIPKVSIEDRPKVQPVLERVIHPVMERVSDDVTISVIGMCIS